MSRSGTVSEASRDGAGSVCAGLRANASISRIVTDSASSASPAAAILTAALTVPASALQLHPHATVVFDEAAAAKLALADYFRETWAAKPSWQGL